MPATLLLNMRPNAAAGLANDVVTVNQYAAPMYAATMSATRDAGARRMTSRRPKVATASAIHCPVPERTFVENWKMLMSNIACASQTPSIAPTSCETTYGASIGQGRAPPCVAGQKLRYRCKGTP